MIVQMNNDVFTYNLYFYGTVYYTSYRSGQHAISVVSLHCFNTF